MSDELDDETSPFQPMSIEPGSFQPIGLGTSSSTSLLEGQDVEDDETDVWGVRRRRHGNTVSGNAVRADL